MYSIPKAHQASFCLTANYTRCSVYIQLNSGKRPINFTVPNARLVEGRPRSHGTVLLAAFVFIALFITAGLLFQSTQTNDVEPTADNVSVAIATPSPAAVAAATMTPAPPTAAATATTAGATATNTVAPTEPPTPTQTATASPLPTSTPTTASVAAPTTTPTTTASPTPLPQAVVISERVNVRSGPGFAYDVLATVNAGAVFTATGRVITDDWIEVCCVGDGRSGWLFLDLVELNAPLTLLPVILDLPPLPTATLPPP